MFFKKFAFIIGITLCALAVSTVSAVAKCNDGILQTIYSEGLGKNVSDFSWSSTRKFDCAKPVHSGKKSMCYTAKNYEGIYLAIGTPFSPSEASEVSFMVHGGLKGNQKLVVKFTSAHVPTKEEFYLYGPDSCVTNASKTIAANGWVNAVINTNNLPPKQYDGIQFHVEDKDDQGTVCFDDIIINKRCAADGYRNYGAPCVCKPNDCVSFIAKEDKGGSWKSNGVEVQQYTIFVKNMNKKAIAAVEFTPVYAPASKKDIWGIDEISGGKYTIPLYACPLAPGKNYSFGCVAKKGAVEYKVNYIEYKQ